MASFTDIIIGTAGLPAGCTVSSNESDFTDATPFEIQIEFTKPVTGFIVGDIDVGTPPKASLSNFAGSGTSYTADATPLLNGDIPISVAENVTNEGNSASNVVTVTDNYVPPAIGFDAVNIGTGLTLSNSNKTVARTDTAGGTLVASNARSVYSKSDNAVYYAEIHCDFGVVSQAYIGVRDVNDSESLRVGFDTNGFSLYQNGQLYKNGVFQSSDGRLNYFSTMILQIAFNPSNGKIWMGKNGTMIGNPAAGTGNIATIDPGELTVSVTPYRYQSGDHTFTIQQKTGDCTYTVAGTTPLGD